MCGSQAVFKLCTTRHWYEACAGGELRLSAADKADGFVHLSTQKQVQETAAKHFSYQKDLVLLALKIEKLGDALVYEPSRGGDMFPHLYAPLLSSYVVWARPLKLRADGVPDIERVLVQ